jgi:hypothetical protein
LDTKRGNLRFSYLLFTERVAGSDLERMAIELEVAGSTPNTDNTLEVGLLEPSSWLGLIISCCQIYLDTAHDVTSFASSECILQAEIDTIVAALQGLLQSWFDLTVADLDIPR